MTTGFNTNKIKKSAPIFGLLKRETPFGSFPYTTGQNWALTFKDTVHHVYIVPDRVTLATSQCKFQN